MNMRWIFKLCVISALIISATEATRSYAQGFLGGSSGLDAKFCEKKTIRQTVVYIDDMMMVDGQSDWATKLNGKLQATLIPSEKVSVVRLSPNDGQSSEIWAGCWPAYTDAEKAKLAGGSYIFSKSPLAQIADQQKFFTRDFGAAISKIYLDAKRPAKVGQVDPASPPHKDIIRALSSDESRFSHSEQTIRAVIYSDLAENSDMGSVFKPADKPTNYGKELGTYLRRSVFYGFGVGADVKGGSEAARNTRPFWIAALSTMGATVGGLGSDLNVPNAIPVEARAYSVTLNEDGQELDGRLSLLMDSDGTLVDSWMGISRLSSAALTGSYHCDAKDPPNCRITATSSHGIISDAPSEVLTLRGDEVKGLTGQFGVKDAKVLFPITATRSAD